MATDADESINSILVDKIRLSKKLIQRRLSHIYKKVNRYVRSTRSYLEQGVLTRPNGYCYNEHHRKIMGEKG